MHMMLILDIPNKAPNASKLSALLLKLSLNACLHEKGRVPPIAAIDHLYWGGEDHK
jgi:hypothetical protein